MLPVPNLSPNPILRIPGAPGLIESTQHNFSPIIHGATLTVDRFGRPNNAYAFDGVDDYIEVPHNPALNLSREYSLVTTFKNTACPSDASGIVVDNRVLLTMHVMEKKGSFRITLLQFVSNMAMPVYVVYHHGTAAIPAFYQTSVYPPNNYHQLAITYANRNLRVALDGQIKEEFADIDGPVESQEPLILGNTAYLEETKRSAKFFKGVIDQVQIFDWALSDAAISKLYAPLAL